MTPAAGQATLPAPQRQILTVTLNPALDVTSSAPGVVADVKLRCTPPIRHPGGGGVNVSRAIAAMGGQSRCLAALGGLTGTAIARLLEAEGIAPLAFPLSGETRQSITIDDSRTGQQYRFVMPGPGWSEAEAAAILRRISDEARDGYVVLSGSFPPGIGAGFIADLTATLRGSARLAIDTSGPALTEIASGRAGPVAILRMNAREAEELAGRDLPDRHQTAALARELVARGTSDIVVIARGTDGNIAASAQGCWHVVAAPVRIASKVGAGDSFMAGFVLGLARGWTVADALGLGAAAASATVQRPATELCRPEDVEALFAARVVTPLP